MQKIKNFRFPIWSVRIMLVVSFVLAESINARSTIFMLMVSPIAANTLLLTPLNFMVYIMVGVMYWGILELILSFLSRSLRQPYEVKNELTRLFFLYYALINVCVFLFRLCYYFHPNVLLLGDTVIAPSLYFIGFFGLIYLIVKREIVPKYAQGRVIFSMAAMFFGANLVFTVSTLFGLAG